MKTAEKIIKKKGDYILAVKQNQPQLHADISQMFEFMLTNKCEQRFKRSGESLKYNGKIVKKTAYVLHDIKWLQQRSRWVGLASVEAIFTEGDGFCEWRYFIASQSFTPQELLRYTQAHWRVEPYHWELDVNFREDYSRTAKENAQKTLNVLRKTALNIHKIYNAQCGLRKSISKRMLECLVDERELCAVLDYYKTATV